MTLGFVGDDGWSPMSGSTLRELGSEVDEIGAARDVALDPRRLGQTLVAPLELLGFWSAIALPALYLPLLVTGLDTTSELVTFLALLGLHLVALVIGRSYRAN